MGNDRLKCAAIEIFREALGRVDSGDAVRKAVRSNGATLWVRDAPVVDLSRSIYVVAIGKAAYPMAGAFEEVAGQHIKAGVISGARLPGNPSIGSRWQKFFGGHPLPNEESFEAATACLSMLEQASDERVPIVFLISGGGSAMMELPSDPRVTLSDLRQLNEVLIASGASIAEINAVRRAASAVKGGGLALRAASSHQFSLIVSDTRSDDVTSVASGPSLLPGAGTPDPLKVLERYDLKRRVPEILVRSLDGKAPASSKLSGSYEVLLDNGDLVRAAAEVATRRGFTVGADTEEHDEIVDVGVGLLLDRAANFQKGRLTSQPACFVSGGEFGCIVNGNGEGGRNCESVVRAGLQSDKLRVSQEFAFLSAGSDGIDGNSPAAGGVIDGSTFEKARTLGLDPIQYLEESDSYSFLNAVDAAIETGPTGTNVRDIRIVIVS